MKKHTNTYLYTYIVDMQTFVYIYIYIDISSVGTTGLEAQRVLRDRLMVLVLV